jgi:hypothetical protein
MPGPAEEGPLSHAGDEIGDEVITKPADESPLSFSD